MSELTYGLTLPFEDANLLFLDISHERFESLRKAKEALSSILSIEEKIGMIIANYEDFEHELLYIALHRMIYGGRDWSTTMGDIHSINRKVVNLLTTCRQYMDQVEHDLSAIYGDASVELQNFRSFKSYQYDNYFEYRFIEAIRNYMQHRSMPISRMHYWMQRNKQTDNEYVEHYILPHIEVKRIIEDKKFKASIREELGNMPEKLDIKPLIRTYVSCIGRIHVQLRANLKADFDSWSEMLTKATEEYHQFYSGFRGTGIHLLLVERQPSGETSNTISIFLDLPKRTSELALKHHFLTHFADNIVSNRELST